MIVNSEFLMHDVIHRALEQLNANNAYECIHIITSALEHDESPYLRRELTKKAPAGAKAAPLGGNGESILSHLLPTATIGGILSPPKTPLFGGGASGVGSTFTGSTAVRRLMNESAISAHLPSDGGAIPTGTVVAAAESGKDPPRGPPPLSAAAGVLHGGPDGTAGGGGKGGRPGGGFNRIQLLRLLLLRCDAYSMVKQYKKALGDAITAVAVSDGRSPQACFYLGREYRRFLQIPEAVAAFDAAEALLRGILRADRAGLTRLTGDLLPEPTGDDDFWAQRGRRGGGVGEGETEKEKEKEKESEKEKVKEKEMGDAYAAAMEGGNARCLRLFGMSVAELAGWRRRASEARSVMAVQGHHTVAFPTHNAMLTLLSRRIATVRGGLVLSIENALPLPMHLLGCVAPDASFYVNFDFPATIEDGHCGLAMLQPRKWGGYSGSVCYALGEKLCCFFYFERTMMGTTKFGVHFHDVLTDALRRVLRQTTEATPGIRTGHIAPPGNGGAEGLSNPLDGRLTPTLKGSVLVSSAAAHASRLVALNALQKPPTTAWVSTHSATLPDGRLIKASAYLHGNQTICFSLSEIPSVRVKDVELLPALEYAGPLVLKKLSAVSKHYREVVNQLPPPMFFGGERHAYPDYCAMGDGRSSPWVLREERPVTWRILFESRAAEREEFHVLGKNTPPQAFLYIVTNAQTKVASTVYYGDCRCPLLAIRESRIPFKSTLYFTTPLGRTFASCSGDVQERFSLTLNVGGVEEVLYTAHLQPEGGVPHRWEGLVGPFNTLPASPSSITSGALGLCANDEGAGSGMHCVHEDKSGMSGILPMTYAKQFSITRPARPNEAAATTPTGNEIHSSNLMAKVRISPIGYYSLNKRAVVGEMTFMPGADTLLLTAMVFCMIRW